MTQLRTPAGGLTVVIDQRVLRQVNDYHLGLIAIPHIVVAASDPGVEAALTTAEDDLHALAPSRAAISALPPIAAWREAYRAVGLNPARFPCAAESLIRRVVTAGRLPRINAMVDLCNSISISTHLPVATCDVGDIGDRLSVRPAGGGEKFVPLGAPDQVEHPGVGEIVYADEEGRALSRRWNWRQGDVVRTGVGEHRLLITVESVLPGGRTELEATLGRIAGLLGAFGVVQPETAILDQNTTEAALFAVGRIGQ